MPLGHKIAIKLQHLCRLHDLIVTRDDRQGRACVVAGQNKALGHHSCSALKLVLHRHHLDRPIQSGGALPNLNGLPRRELFSETMPWLCAYIGHGGLACRIINIVAHMGFLVRSQRMDARSLPPVHAGNDSSCVGKSIFANQRRTE